MVGPVVVPVGGGVDPVPVVVCVGVVDVGAGVEPAPVVEVVGAGVECVGLEAGTCAVGLAGL